MSKIKLLKPGAMRTDGITKASKSIEVETTTGNKHILKATVLSVSPEAIQKNQSHAIEDALDDMGISSQIVRPPLSQGELAILQDYSSELGQIIDVMSVGIEGFGGRLLKRKMNNELEEKMDAAIKEEKSWLDSFFELPNPKGSFVKLRRETREDLESTGNAYWELVPSPVKKGRYSQVNRIDAPSMYITKVDERLTPMRMNFIDSDGLSLRSKTFLVRFRKYVQVMGAKKVWFKEFGDPRCLDRRTGEVIDPEKVNKKYWANEVFHHRIYTPKRTPYGLPRFTGNIIAIKGSRSADETNIMTQQNNHVPSMAVLVSGGALTEGSIQRLKEFVDTQIKGNSNYSKFLILEGESGHDSLSGSSSMKIEVKPLSDNQHKDQLWQEYDKNNASKLRRSFRIAPILVGSSENYDRATAQTSEAMTEKYVFNPERVAMDENINQLLLQQGFRFWKFKSNAPNTTNDEDLVRIITGGEKTGAVTPRIARMMLEDILNRELPDPDFEKIPDDLKPYFNPDVPFSLGLARMMSSAGAANANGTFANQGQTPLPPGQPGRPSADGTPAQPSGAAAATAEVKATALNGAQVTALLDVVSQVARGQIPYESGIQAIQLGFGLTSEQAKAILDPTNNFRPTAQDQGQGSQPPTPGPQTPPDATAKLFESLDPMLRLNKMSQTPEEALNLLFRFQQTLEEDIDKEAFGKSRKDYFNRARKPKK